MRRSISLAIVALLAAVGLVLIAVAWSGTATKPPEGFQAAPLRSDPSEPSVQDHERQASQEPQLLQTGNGIAAMEQAAQGNKYLFAFFWKEENEQTLAGWKVFEAAMKEVADKADWVAVDTADASQREIVEKFDLDRAPMPLVLALAPNGAVTGGFPTEFGEQELLQAFATPCTEKCMKSLQENKLVFLCVQNANTKSNDLAMRGVRDFTDDARFGDATAILTLDPADPAEAEFLDDLQIDPKSPEALTVFLAPPGVPIAIFEGATSKDELIATLQKASTACGPGGCGPGGCPPAKSR